jgi:hypothetical protein
MFFVFVSFLAAKNVTIQAIGFGMASVSCSTPSSCV